MQLISRLCGYLRITYPEKVRSRLFRLLHAHQIPIIETKMTSDGFCITVSRSAYRAMSEHKEIMDLQALGTKHGGAPVHLRALLKRPGILCGITLGLMLFFFCRARIWEVRIVGDGSIDEDAMRHSLASAGLSEGMRISSLDCERTVASYLSEERRVCWMQIRREGVIAYVEWLPTKFGEQVSEEHGDVGANLVASEDAVIEDIRIQSGHATVSRGSVVKAGDLLVSGIDDNGVAYASGEVIGRVRRTVTVSVPFVQTGERIISEKSGGLRLTVFQLPFSFGFGKRAADAVQKSAVWLFDSIRLPIYTERELIYETEAYECVLSESDAVRLAQRRLASELQALLANGELLSQKTKGCFTEQGYTITAEIEYLINIAKTLEFSSENE